VDVVAVDAYMQARADDDTFSGVVRIERSAEVLLERGYGLASRAWGVPCSPEQRFDTASVTKLFTAVAVLQQVEAGAFSLDVSATGYLGLEGTAIDPAVTPYHLLTHTSGIGDDADEEDGVAYETVFAERPNYSITETVDFLPQCAHNEPKFGPGEGTRYCNCSYVLLGLMVERASGMRYRDYVVRHVFGPAEMDRSGFFRLDRIEPDVAEGADPVTDASGAVVGWRRGIYSYPPVGSPDGGAYVTARDLIAFHDALRNGRLLGEELTAAILRPKEDYRELPTGSHRTGYGFEFEVDRNGEVTTYWKNGVNVGVSAALAYWPRQDVTFAVLSNREDGAWKPIDAIRTALRDDLRETSGPAPEAPSE
jgi:CubicO group peptidase (beta-lactamase class C family)